MGNLCHIPVLVGNVSCSALVDTGSTATLVRPDVVPAGTVLEQTTVRLQTVTGQTAAMKGRGTFVFTVGGVTVTFTAWVADVRDLCILGLDFLRLTGCSLDLGAGVLVLPEGQRVQLMSPSQQVTQVVPTYNLTAHPGLASSHVLGGQPGQTGLPAEQADLTPQHQPMDTEDRFRAVRGIWERNCTGLDDQQKMQLWQLLWEFKDIFALSELTHLVEHHIETGAAKLIRLRPRRLLWVKQQAADEEVRAM